VPVKRSYIAVSEASKWVNLWKPENFRNRPAANGHLNTGFCKKEIAVHHRHFFIKNESLSDRIGTCAKIICEKKLERIGTPAYLERYAVRIVCDTVIHCVAEAM
jgi:hypothetical protein